ncbi:MAG: TetR/AcrR family transcriptional regulator [Acidimicrobiia bacterium]|nr:TetR/AcrR family transcriptional regulator [Acidimicrobiia bacterium]
MAGDTRERILAAAKRRLLEEGYAALSTRKVAADAGVPLSQIHYHFGSKEQLIVSLLREENERLLDRQSEMFGRDLPLWERWVLACDYFDDDLASGYVRVAQELTAAGWSSERLRTEMREIWGGWSELLLGVVRDATIDLGLEPEELVALVSAVFVGAEALILLGMEDERTPFRRALRRVGDLIRVAEERGERAGSLSGS